MSRLMYSWTKEDNDTLRRWVEEGLTVPQMRDLTEEAFGVTLTDSQIRSHCIWLGIEPKRARKMRQSMFTAEQKLWVYDHCHLPPTYLVKRFRVNFPESTIEPRFITNLANKAQIAIETKRTPEEYQAEWMRVKQRLSPRGHVARRHWLWRYLPFDNYRKTSGVTFRGDA